MLASSDKIEWQGRIVSVQPRIRLTRSYDQRSYSYVGYALRIDGHVGGRDVVHTVGIGAQAQARHRLQVGDVVTGLVLPVVDPRTEPVEYYHVSRLRVIERVRDQPPDPAPWLGVPPPLPEYRARGHRRLDARTYATRCAACIWGCRMPVEIIVDQWNPSRRRHRFETFCYGPKSCPVYRAGPTRKVQGRKDYMVYEEDDWVDEDGTMHRGADE